MGPCADRRRTARLLGRRRPLERRVPERRANTVGKAQQFFAKGEEVSTRRRQPFPAGRVGAFGFEGESCPACCSARSSSRLQVSDSSRLQLKTLARDRIRSTD